jgi:hypothetical protein
MKHYTEREQWLNAFPGVRKKFLNQCIVCQEVGYDPGKIQTKDGKFFKFYIKKYWHPLTVNELGMCVDCAARLEGDGRISR